MRAILLCGDDQTAVFLVAGISRRDDKLMVLDGLLE